MAPNYTPIDDIVSQHNEDKQKKQSVTITKEGEPIELKESGSAQEIQPSEAEPAVEQGKVSDYLQEVNQDEFKLDPELKKAGLKVISKDTLDPRYHVELPISDDKVVQGLDQPITSSWRWLAEVARFMLAQAHLSLKKIHGKVVRVIQK